MAVLLPFRCIDHGRCCSLATPVPACVGNTVECGNDRGNRAGAAGLATHPRADAELCVVRPLTALAAGAVSHRAPGAGQDRVSPQILGAVVKITSKAPEGRQGPHGHRFHRSR